MPVARVSMNDAGKGSGYCASPKRRMASHNPADSSQPPEGWCPLAIQSLSQKQISILTTHTQWISSLMGRGHHTLVLNQRKWMMSLCLRPCWLTAVNTRRATGPVRENQVHWGSPDAGKPRICCGQRELLGKGQMD